MSIFGAIFQELLVDLDNYKKRRKGKKIFQRYFISKEAAKLAARLAGEIDAVAHELSTNHNRHLRPSKKKHSNNV